MKRLSLIALAMAACICASAQITISGKIKNEEGSELIGATVSLKETYQGTTTNTSGEYKIENVSSGKYTLEVTYMGFNPNSDTIEVESKDLNFNFSLTKKAFMTDEVLISATRANDLTPMAKTTLTKEEIEANNLGQDLPYLIRLTPSVVTTSDAGAGVGYTGIRIRGSDATRTNVTINGIPLNDPESQGVWWVNMPDFASSVNSIQIQRGVGSSTNGAGAFGGSINLQTNEQNPDPYGEINVGGGSFGTAKANVIFGTGNLGQGFSMDGRISKIKSDGYIDRASSDLESYYLTGAYHGKKASVRAIAFGGTERTYQAWYGVPGQFLDSARTFNPYTYDNEVDNYTQNHYQLLTAFELSSSFSATVNFHYTKGKGYFEQYKGEQYNSLVNLGSKEVLADYGIAPVITSNGDTITESNLIRRRWLDNDFYGTVFSLNYDSGGKLKAVLGGGVNQYIGNHFGNVIWAEYASDSDYNHEYYRNKATKNDINIYLKGSYQATDKINVFADLQFRNVGYNFTGIDQFGNPIPGSESLNFFNPKLGLNYNLNSKSEIYGSAAVGNKEPSRNDYVQNVNFNRPKSEQMIDYELGYNLRGKRFGFNANAYFMDYTNQLVVTGEYDNVGENKRVNVANSYRAGLELVVGLKPLKWIELNANVTLSQNKIEKFTEYRDNWDTGGQDQIEHSNSDIAFSPNLISAQELKFWIIQNKGEKQIQNFSISILGKYVGAQYLDNTQNDNRKLDAYYVNDLRFEYCLKDFLFKEIGLTFTVNNILNQKYVSNAWSYAFQSDSYDPTPDDPYTSSEGGGVYNSIGHFPNATTYFLAGLRIKI